MRRGRRSGAGQRDGGDAVRRLQSAGRELRAGEGEKLTIGFGLVIGRHRQQCRGDGAGCRVDGDGVVVAAIAVRHAVRAGGDERAGIRAQHVFAGIGLGERAVEGVAHLQPVGDGCFVRTGGAVIDTRVCDRADRQRPDRDVGPRHIGSRRHAEGCKEIKNRIVKGGFKSDRLLDSYMLGIEKGVGDQPQRDRRRCIRGVGFQAADRCVAQPVIDLVVSFSEDPCFYVQRSATRHVQAVSQNFAVGAGVSHRIEANAELTRTDGQAVDAAINSHGPACNSRAGAIVVGAQYHVATGHRHGRRDVHVLSCNRSEISSGNRRGCIQADIAGSIEFKAASRGGGGRIQIDIAS